MGASEQTITLPHSKASHLAAPTFIKSAAKILLVAAFVGASYVAVGEGLRFYRETKQAYIVKLMKTELDNFMIDEETLKTAPREQISKALYVCNTDRFNAYNAFADIQNAMKKATPK